MKRNSATSLPALEWALVWIASGALTASASSAPAAAQSVTQAPGQGQGPGIQAFLDCNDNGVADVVDVRGAGLSVFRSAPGLAIPDADPIGASDTLFVPDSFVLADVVVGLNLAHTANGDLTVILEHDGLAAVLLAGPGRANCSEPGGYDDDGVRIVVDDEGRPALHFYREEVGAPSGALRGRWRPDTGCGEGILSVFDGSDAAGPWTLTVLDDSAGEFGSLVSWRLELRDQTPTSSDCNGNGVPDECDPDCNGNLVPDDCEADCNGNGLADECDLAAGTSLDLNGDSVPDECEVDCNGNGVPDDLDIQSGLEQDGNGNGSPDSCDLSSGRSSDLQGDGVPDELQLGPNDCNENAVPDDAELALGLSPDCNANGSPDECDILFGASQDLDLDGRPDECGPAGNPPFQILGVNPGQAGEGDTLLIDSTGFPSNNPFDYCVQLGAGRGQVQVQQVRGNVMRVLLDAVTDPGLSPIHIAPGFGLPVPPFSDTSIVTEQGRAFTGFQDAASSGLFDTRAVATNASRFFRLPGRFGLGDGGTLTIPVEGSWQKGDKMKVDAHMLLANGTLWDFSEVITFSADGTTRACAQKMVERYNAVATAAGCDCTASLTAAPANEIKITCTGGSAGGFGSVVLQEWSEQDVGSVRGEFDVERDADSFEVDNTVGDNTTSVSIPITRIREGETVVEWGCKYLTDLNGFAGNLKIVSASGCDNMRIIQTVKGTRTLKRGGALVRNLLPALAAFALDGGTAAAPDYNSRGVGWPLTQGQAILDFVSTSADAATAGRMAGDKVCMSCEFQTFIVCDNQVIGFISWTTSAELCIGATPAMSTWSAPPAPASSWVERDMTAGSAFRDALNHLNGLVDNDLD